MVIGESFSKSHSSLYDYDKETNPRLSSMVSDSLLVVYDNVIAPSTSTIKAFQSIMSTYKQEYGDDVNWYECTTLQEVISLAGYRTIWISNQSPSGVYDNVVSEYAKLCDSTIWVGEKYKGILKKDFDEEVINELKCLKERSYFNDEHNHFVFVHLMGSHPSFKDRYPCEFSVFTTNCYNHFPKQQREELAHYDNSILYNDYVVSECLGLFNNTECIAFYFPDHGLDCYDTSESYFGHARLDIPKSIEVSKRIPFLVYMSPDYKRNNRKEALDIIDKSTLAMNTEDLFLLLMDLLGIDYQIDELNKGL